MASLPVGWGDRKNQMSEHDIKLGGMAAGSFKSKNSYEHDPGFGGYKSSEQVREYYLNNPPKEGSGVETKEGHGERGDGNLPDFWLDRQRQKESDGKQMGCFSSSKKNENGPTNQVDTGGTPDEANAELALVKVATFALENMTASLAQSSRTNQLKVPPQDRAAFAAAVKGAMDVIAKLK